MNIILIGRGQVLPCLEIEKAPSAQRPLMQYIKPILREELFAWAEAQLNNWGHSEKFRNLMANPIYLKKTAGKWSTNTGIRSIFAFEFWPLRN